MAILGRGRPNNAKIIWAGTFAIPEVTGDSAQTLDDFISAASGSLDQGIQPGGGIGIIGYGPSKPKAKKTKKAPAPALVFGSARSSLAALSSTAEGFYDIRPVIDAENEILLLI